jgi:hypothetical protein
MPARRKARLEVCLRGARRETPEDAARGRGGQAAKVTARVDSGTPRDAPILVIGRSAMRFSRFTFDH